MEPQEEKSPTIPYYMIVNIGTLLKSQYAQSYPRHLILAQLWEANDDYRNQVLLMSASGTDFIMDNGAHEGIDIDPSSYIEILDESRPKTAVLTDLVGRPNDKSRQCAMKLADGIDRRFPEMHMMYVPQGQNQEQVLDEYDWAFQNLDPKKFIIGFGQGYLQWQTDAYFRDEIARQEMVERAMTLRKRGVNHRCHILGARWAPSSWFGLNLENVVGLDTIKPCTCAFTGTTYPAGPGLKAYKPIDRMSLKTVKDEDLAKNVSALCAAYHLKAD